MPPTYDECDLPDEVLAARLTAAGVDPATDERERVIARYRALLLGARNFPRSEAAESITPWFAVDWASHRGGAVEP